MKYISILTFLSILLASCVPASTALPTNVVTNILTPTGTFTPEPTETFTPEPTATPAPVDLIGILFLDANGSGLRDETSFVCPTDIAKPPSLVYFFPDVAECAPDEIVKIMEPGLVGLEVSTIIDGEKISTETDSDGIYRLLIPNGTEGQSVKIEIADPNADDVALAMRYINQWNKTVKIPTFRINNIDIPEQTLNDTTVKPLKDGVVSKIGTDNITGLMQGWLTLPFRQVDLINPIIWNGFDIFGNPNKRDGVISNYYGITRQGNPFIPIVGQMDSHSGLDFVSPIGTFTAACMSGGVENIVRGDGEIALFLTNNGLKYWSNYGHLEMTFSKVNQRNVFRGQIIARTGNSGNNNTWFGGPKVSQLHWDIAKIPGDNLYVDPFATTIAPKDGIVFSGNTVSLWTVYNLPVFP